MSNFDLPPVDDGISLGDLFQNGNRKRKLAKPVKGVKSKKEDVTVPLSGMAPSSSSSRKIGPTTASDLPPDDDGEIDFFHSGTLSAPHVLPKAKLAPKGKAAPISRKFAQARKKHVVLPKDHRDEPTEDELREWSHASLKHAAALIPSVVDMPYTDMCSMLERVPSNYVDRCTLWEIFSVPRLAPCIRALGGTCRRSYDIQHFFNLGNEGFQRTLLQDISTFRPFYLSLSPPCTYLCKLMASNWSRMRGQQKFLNLEDDLGYIDLCSWLMAYQVKHGLYFGLEHPHGSLAWSRASVTTSYVFLNLFLCKPRKPLC